MIDVNTLKKEIARLNLELKSNNDFTTLFDRAILEIINLRNKFRSEGRYSESDEIRDLLDNLDITIEDNKTTFKLGSLKINSPVSTNNFKLFSLPNLIYLSS